VLIDGGRGQLNAAREGLHELGFEDILVVGVAKGVDRNRFDLVHPDHAEPFVLPRESKALHLVQQIDEEAHRFAITYHRKLRDRSAFASPLDEVSGIGPKRKRALLKRFGSIEGIRRATAEEVAAVPGMTRKVADELKELIG
jgi:excinuclease ABC subunit C